MKKKVIIACIMAFLGQSTMRVHAACTPLANTPGTTAWTIADQIRAVAGSEDPTGDNVFLIRQSDLPLTITERGKYLVTESLSMSGTSDAITVSASRVFIDFQGHTLTQGSSLTDVRHAIVVGNQPNVHIANGTIRLGSVAVAPGTFMDVIGFRFAADATNVSCINMRIVGRATTTVNLWEGTGMSFNGSTLGNLYFKDVLITRIGTGIISGTTSVVTDFVMRRVTALNVTGTAFDFNGSGYDLEDCQAILCDNGFVFSATSSQIICKNCLALSITGVGFSASTAPNVQFLSCVARAAATGFLGGGLISQLVHNCSATDCTTPYSGFSASSGFSFLPAATSTANWWYSLANT